MYIRPKVVGGQTYYQVVESRREDGKVRQRVVVSLSGAASVVGARSMLRRSITRWKRERKKADISNPPPVYRRRLESLDRSIAKAEARLAILDGLPDLEFSERGEPNQAGTTPPVVPGDAGDWVPAKLDNAFGAIVAIVEHLNGRPMEDAEFARLNDCLLGLLDGEQLYQMVLQRRAALAGTTPDATPVVPGDQPPDERFTLG